MLWIIPFSLVTFNLQIINTFLLGKKEKKKKAFLCLFVCFFLCVILHYHSTSVLTLPFSHFLCDCSVSCFLYFVRFECNMLEVYIGSPMQLISSEPGFHLKWAKWKGSRKWRQRRREKVIYISEVANALTVILKENTSLFR